MCKNNDGDFSASLAQLYTSWLASAVTSKSFEQSTRSSKDLLAWLLGPIQSTSRIRQQHVYRPYSPEANDRSSMWLLDRHGRIHRVDVVKEKDEKDFDEEFSTPSVTRILYLAHNVTPGHSGGYAHRTHMIAKAYETAGCDVKVIKMLADDAHLPRGRSYQYDGINYAVTGGLNPKEIYEPTVVATYADELHTLVKDYSPDVIHAGSFWPNGLVAHQLSCRFGVPFIYEVRGLHLLNSVRDLSSDKISSFEGFRRSSRNMFMFHNELQVAQAADKVAFISSQLRELFVGLGVERSKTALLPNGFARSLGSDKRCRTVRESDSSYLRVGYIGSFQWYEGIDLLLEGSLKAARRGLKVELVLVGDGPARSRIESQFEQLPCIPNLKASLLPRQSWEDSRALLLSLDALILPRVRASITEFVPPMKALEAMSLGVPVACSDVGGFDDQVVHRQNGLRFGSNSSDEVADCLIGLGNDPRLLAALKESCIEPPHESSGWVDGIRSLLGSMV